MEEEYIRVMNVYLEARVKVQNTERLLPFVKIPRWRALVAIMETPTRQSMPWDYPSQPFEIRLSSGAIHMFNGAENAVVTDLRNGKTYPYTSLY